jgi:opacity protein-like surface antigen
MRSLYKNTSAIAVMVLALGAAANAADMPRFPSALPPLETPPLLVDEFSSGWYLRGDVGYRFNNDVDKVEHVGLTPSVSHPTLQDSWAVGGGVGYKWEWLRSDLTVDYGTKARFSGDSSLQPDDFKAKIDNVTALLNFYGDLGTWWGFTPYIGAGLGATWLQVTDFRVESSGLKNDAGRSDQWNFAWAYMAGVSYRFSGNFLLDVGYRHLNMGDIATEKDSLQNSIKFKKLSTDEVRVGFRYVID